MHGVSWMVLSCLFFSVVNLCVKQLQGLPTWEVAFFRSVINLAIIFPFALRSMPTRLGMEFRFVLLRGLAGALSIVLYFYSIQHLRLAEAVLLNYSSPLPTLLLSTLFLGESISRFQLGFLGLAFCGVGLVLQPTLGVASFAGFAGLISAFTAAVAYTSMKRATREYSTSFIVFIFTLVATLLTLGPALVSFRVPERVELPYLLGVGLAATCAQIAMTKGYRYLPAHVASIISLFTVALSMFLGWVIWGEPVSLTALFGGFLIVAGVIGISKFHVSKA